MKLNGTFAIREIAGEILVVPVGETALELNGMIILNPVSKVIWDCLEQGTTAEAILTEVTDRFEVSPEEAGADIAAFLADLREHGLIAEDA